jgi:hypothetical protein
VGNVENTGLFSDGLVFIEDAREHDGHVVSGEIHKAGAEFRMKGIDWGSHPWTGGKERGST